METIIRLHLSELTNNSIDKVKDALRKMSGEADPEVFISLSAEEFNKKYFSQLDASIQQMQNGNSLSFTMEELATYVKKEFSE